VSSSRLSWRHAGDPAVLICCGFGSGFLPKAPGTWGSVLALIIWWGMLAHHTVWVQLLVCAAVLLLSVALIDRLHRRYGVGDDPTIVIDEFVGLWLVLAWVPEHWAWAIVGFVAFRVFDIVKPWPINVLDARVHGGFGVMLDDLVAGLIALIVVWISYFGVALAI
jgi:phosphatidylglycerophosphatase A